VTSRRLPVLVLAALVGVAAGGAGQAPRDAADGDFVRHMLVHHTRALALGRLAALRGSDPRVRAFGRRILTEQTPEHDRLSGWVGTLGLSPAPAVDAAHAAGYVTDAQVAALQRLTGAAFDRQVLLLSASSEQGAVAMARTELADGRYAPARALATSISGAPRTEIPQLRALAAQV